MHQKNNFKGKNNGFLQQNNVIQNVHLNPNRKGNRYPIKSIRYSIGINTLILVFVTNPSFWIKILTGVFVIVEAFHNIKLIKEHWLHHEDFSSNTLISAIILFSVLSVFDIYKLPIITNGQSIISIFSSGAENVGLILIQALNIFISDVRLNFIKYIVTVVIATTSVYVALLPTRLTIDKKDVRQAIYSKLWIPFLILFGFALLMLSGSDLTNLLK